MRELYELISSLSSEVYTLLAVLFGMILVDDLTVAEQRALGGFFMLMGKLYGFAHLKRIC